jgi:hypothetical protein
MYEIRRWEGDPLPVYGKPRHAREVELNPSILCRFRVLEVRFGYSWLRLEFQSVVFGYGFGSDFWGLGFLQEKSLQNFDLGKLVMSIPLFRTT